MNLYTADGQPVTLYDTDGGVRIGPATGGGNPTPTGTDPATLTTLRSIVDKQGWYRFKGKPNENGWATSITAHTVHAPAKSLRVRWGANDVLGVPPGIAGTAGLIIRGVLYRLTWAGDPTYPHATTAGFATSDPLPESVQVEAGETIYALWETPAGGLAPAGSHAWDSPMSAAYAGRFTGTVPQMATNRLYAAPQGIYGLTLPSTRNLLCLGDSILESGWMRQATVAEGWAWADLSQWLESTPQTNLPNRLAPGDPQFFTHALSEYGTNNISTNVDNSDAVKAAMVASWQWLTAGPVGLLGQCTMTPRTSSTDGWTTVEGQTPWTGETPRLAINAWLRDGAPLIDGAPAAVGATGAVRVQETGHPLQLPICDIADAAETSRNSGIWRVDNGKPTGDGTHPMTGGAGLLQGAAEAWLAAIT